MYADDIVLLSKSSEEMQNNLSELSKYCTKWKLDINTSKTKILQFNKSKNDKKKVFTFNDCKLESVEEYKYLGIIINRSGSFKSASENLNYKGMKALFKLKKKHFHYKHKTIFRTKNV